MHKRSMEAKYKRPPPSGWGIGHMAYQTAAGPRDTNGPSCVLGPFYHFLLHILIYILSNIFSYAYSPIFSVRFFALCVLCVSYMYVCTVHPVCSDYSIVIFWGDASYMMHIFIFLSLHILPAFILNYRLLWCRGKVAARSFFSARL